MGYRKGKSEGGGSGLGGGSNIMTIILGGVAIVLAMIGLGIAMNTIGPLLTGGASALNWTRYPGGEQMLKLFPLIMMVGLIIFGSLLAWLGTKGKSVTIWQTVMTIIVVVIAVVILPIIMDATDTAYTNEYASSFTGMTSFLGLVPLLYTVALMVISGLLGRKVLTM
jgi:hypothetical protein